MRHLFSEAQQRHQQQQQQQVVPGLQDVVQQQLALFQQVVYSQVAAAQRASEVTALAQAVRQHVLLPIEQLVAAEYAARENWVKEHIVDPDGSVQQQTQQQQPTHLPWYLQQKKGNQPVAPPAPTSSITAVASKATSVQQQELLAEHSFKLGLVKVEALAVLYAMQLQAGQVTWLQLEKQLVAPASSLKQLLEAFQNQQLRRLVVHLVAEVSRYNPSLVRWQQQQQQVMPTSTSPATLCLPADWLLRLWLQAMLDSPSKGCRRTAAHLTTAMMANPNTNTLLQPAAAINSQQLVSALEQDQYGHLRAQWVCLVTKALLAGRHVAAVAAGTGGLRCQDLRDILMGLPQVIKQTAGSIEDQAAVLLAAVHNQGPANPGLTGCVQPCHTILLQAGC